MTLSTISPSYYGYSTPPSNPKNLYWPAHKNSPFSFLYKKGETEEAALKKLEEILKTNPNLDERDLFHQTPLTQAISLSFSIVAMKLIEAGASVVDLTEDGDALVHIAFLYGCETLFYYAFETLKQDVNLQNREKETPLQKLFKNEYLEDNRNPSPSLLRYVFSHSDKKVVDQKGNSLLSLYITSKVRFSEEEKEVIHSHLAHQANKTNNAKEIPLHQYHMVNPRQMTYWLLPLTEDPFILNSRGKPAIISWLDRCYRIEKRSSLKRWYGWTDYLPNDKEKINSATKSGKTLLHLCAKIGLLSIIKELIAKGANPKLCDRNGFNATFYALAYGRIKCFHYLEEQGFGISGIEADERELKPFKIHLQKEARKLFSLIHPSSDSQKERVLTFCLNVLFLERWNLLIDSDKFEILISRLIKLHGEDRFIAACRKLLEDHFDYYCFDHNNRKGLHILLQFVNSSDHINVLSHILHQQRLPSLDRSAYYIKNIFQDVDFWRICKERHSAVYIALITDIAQKLLDDELRGQNEIRFRECSFKKEKPLFYYKHVRSLERIDLAKLLKECCPQTYGSIYEDLFTQKEIISTLQITFD